jgi:outer membrane receptor for ferrienterochelin and colicins
MERFIGGRRLGRIVRLVGFMLPLLLGAVAPLAAQQRVNVTVYVRGPAGPLADAVVTAGGASIVADDRGIVRMRLPAGPHQVRLQHPGFEGMIVPLLLMPQRDTAIVVTMIERLLEEAPIIVRTTRGERRVENAPLRVEVIVRDEIEEKLLMTPGSIAMLLNEAVGVRVQEASPALGGAGIRIQGLGGRYSRILVDGLPLHGLDASGLGPLQIPPMDLEQIEVIKGPASALYGGSALAGVINLISRRPEEGREVLANRTARGGTDVVIWTADDIVGGVGYTLLSGLHAQDPADFDGDGWSELPRHRRIVARPRVFWEDGVNSAMLTGGFLAESRTGGGFVPGGERYNREVETVRGDVGVTARFALDQGAWLELRESFTRTTHAHLYHRRPESVLQQNAFVEFSLHGVAGAHRWVAGIAAEGERLRVSEVEGFDYEQRLPALFVQDEVRIFPWLSASGSGRLDTSARHGTFFSPRAALLLGPVGAWTLRLSSGSGFVLPTPLFDGLEEIGFANVRPADGLVPERGRSVAVDIGASAGVFEFNAAMFSSTIEHPIQFREPSGPGRGQLVNLPSPTRTQGTELLFRARLDNFGLSVFHTFTHAREVDLRTFQRVAVPLTPRHTAGLIAMWEAADVGRIGFESYYTGQQRVPDDIDGQAGTPYIVLGALAERRVGPVRVFVNAENLTNVRLSDDQLLLRSAPTATGRWTTDVWKPVEGRVVNGGFRVFF